MNQWNRFWFSRADVTPLAVSRIAIGFIYLALLLQTAPHWHRFYGYDGMISLGDADLNVIRPPMSWSVMAWTDGILPVAIWWYVGLLITCCLIVGYRTRLATIGLFLFLSSLIHRNPYIVNGEELVGRMITFYGCFAPWGNALSMDAWLRHRRLGEVATEAERCVAVWSWRVMQINFTLIYAISVPYKFAQDMDWLTGDAMHWTIASDIWWQRGWLPELTLSCGGWLRKLITWGTVLLEGAFPVLVCIPRTRVAVVLAMITLHLGIAVCIPGVTLFTLSMVAGLASFLPATFYYHATRRLRGVMPREFTCLTTTEATDHVRSH